MNDEPDSTGDEDSRQRARRLADAQLDVVYGKRPARVHTPWGLMVGNRISGELRDLERRHPRADRAQTPGPPEGEAGKVLGLALLALVAIVAVVVVAGLAIAWTVLG